MYEKPASAPTRERRRPGSLISHGDLPITNLVRHRLALLALFGGLLAIALAAAAAGRPAATPNLQLRTQTAVENGWPSVLLFPSWEFPKDTKYGKFAECFAAHTTLGTLMPQNGQPSIDYHETRPPFPGAPIGGDWLWQCHALGGSGLKYPDPSFCTHCNYSDYFVTGEGKVSGPANVTVYLLTDIGADKSYHILAERSAFVKIAARPGSKPEPTAPTVKRGTKPGVKPRRHTTPTGKKTGKRFTFTARVRGKPVVGGERLFPSYQGSQASMEGSFLTAAPVGDEADIIDANGTVTLAHAYSAFPDERYSLQLAAINSSFTKTFSNGRAVRIGVRVASSSFTGCPAGKTGTVVVSDLTNGDGFEANICGLRLVWVDGRAADVAVTIHAT
jgi:hypothetical protein